MQLPRPWQSIRPTRSVRDLSVETKVCKTKHAPNQNMMTSLQKKTLWESVLMIIHDCPNELKWFCSDFFKSSRCPKDFQRISKGFPKDSWMLLDVPGIPWSCTPLSPPLGLACHEVTRQVSEIIGAIRKACLALNGSTRCTPHLPFASVYLPFSSSKPEIIPKPAQRHSLRERFREQRSTTRSHYKSGLWPSQETPPFFLQSVTSRFCYLGHK